MTRIDFRARDVDRGGNKLILFPEGKGSAALRRAPRIKGPGSRHGRRLRLALMAATILAGAGTLAILPAGQALAQVDLDDVDVTVPGTHASPWAPGDLRVGLSSTASLTISGGGIVNLGRGTIGRNLGSDGTVTVTGAGSEWNMSIWMAVGVGGSGTLIISDGGLVNVTGGGGGSAGTWIGEFVGSDGTITVTGAGSRLVDDGQMRVGVNGSGTLLIENGGTVSNTIGWIGQNNASTGEATVTGVGSRWTNSSNLTVGNSGTGLLTITGGGQVESVEGTIGANGSANGAATVSGAGSRWTNSARLLVGSSGTGTMLIANGGVVSNTWSSIGMNAGSNGAVTVTGAGSEWTNTGDLFVGQSGTGTLTISNGGLVTAPALFVIASQAGSTGTLNIGAAAGDAAVAAGTLDTAAITLGSGNATLVFNHTEANYELDTAISGNGTIRLLAGRTTLSGANSYTGSTLLESGTLTLGSNSALGGSTLRTLGSVVDYTHGLDITNSIIIDSNTTQFQVLAGATATQSGVISEDNGPRPFEKIGDGELILTAANTWTGETTVTDGTLTFDGGSVALTAAMFVGRQNGDDATLNIINGGSVGANGVILAENAGSTGTLNIGAAAGDVAAAAGTLDTPTIAFGTGTGTIVFNHTDGDFELDADISGAGTIRLLAGRTILSGNSSYTGPTLLEGGTLTLGSNNALGNSTLRTTGSVVDYADGVDISNAIIIDSNTTQFQVLTGSATQSGVISEDNGPRPFEKTGDGELVLTAANTWTGDTILSAGTLTFDGGSVALAANRYLYAGRQNGDNSALNIVNGGSVSSEFTYVGDDAGSVGAVTVLGAGSLMTNSAETAVGRSGTGTLNIENGGEVSSTRSWIGRFAGSNGFATVTGTDSLWTHSEYLVVGTAGEGDLTISDSGRVEVAGQGIWISEFADSIGTITVTGAGSTLVNTGTSLRAGNAGTGTLTIENGGTVTNTLGILGNSAGSTGTAIVAGAGSTWTNSGFLYVGERGTGTLTISDEGEVSSDSGVLMARLAGSTGTLNIGAAAGDAAVTAGTLDSDTLEFGLGLGRLVFNHTASSGGAGYVFGADITSDAAGDALIRQLAGFTRLTGNSAGYQGDVEITGGMLSVDGTLGSSDVLASVTNGGALTGSGTLDGDVTIGVGGILAGQSGRTFNIGGDLALQDGALVNVALGAPGGSELFNVGGDLTLDGTLNVSDAGGFGPGLYALFTYGGALTDNGLALGTAPVAGLLPGELTVQTSIAGQVNLVSSIGVDLLFWDGDAPANALNGAIDGGNGVWTANALTFTDANGLVSGPSRPKPGFIVFAGTAGTVTVDDSAGAIEIAGAQFAADGYAIEGNGITLAGNGSGEAILRVGDGTAGGANFTATIRSDLTGNAALVKTDSGTLILSGTNSYTGGTQVRAGTLIGSTASIIGDIANDGVVVFDQAGNAALTQTLSGSGVFRFTGGAVFTLSGANTFSGGSVVSGSGLILTADTSAGTGGIALTDASLAYGSGLNIANALTLSGASTLRVASGAATQSGAITGAGGLVFEGPGTLTLSGTNSYTGGTQVRAGTLIGSTASIIGDIANDGVVVFDQAGNAALTQTLSGSGVFRFTGGAVFTLSGANTFSGGSVVSGSGLILTADTSAGTGGIALTDASLAYGSGLNIANALTLSGASTLRVASGAATQSGAITGAGGLVFEGPGTLTLSGTNSYTGGTQVRAGTLIGSTASIIGDIANDGVVVFDQAGNAALTQTLSGSGVFRFTGGAVFTLGAVNTFSGGSVVSGSGLILTADTSAGTGGIALTDAQLTYSDGLNIANGLTLAGTNSLIVSAGSATHAGSLAGSGDFTLGGAGTLVFSGNGSAFTGQTTITGNVLMNGILGGNIEVTDGGILRGFGTLGSTTLLAGSTIAPGNSVGTLTIDGDLVFEPGSVYALTLLDDGNMDLVEVSGTATIASGAVLSPTSLTGLTFGTRNVILTASGGVTGTFQFDEAISNLAFVSSGLETSANEVVLFFDRNDTPFESLASGGNAASAARAADALGAGNPLWEALVWLDAASAPAAFEALNGEIHATHRQLVLDDTIHTRRAVITRLASARGEASGSAWISGHFGGAQLGSRDGVSRVSADTSGVMLGLDAPVHEETRIGVMAAFGETSFNLTGRNAAGLSESRSLGVYAGTQLGALGVSAGAIYGWHDLSTNRRVSFPGINEQISSSHSADTIQLFSEASLSGPAGLEPFLSLAHVRLDTGGFSEVGGVSALAIGSETRQMTQGTLGSRFAHDWQAGEAALRFEGSLGWRRIFSGHRQFVSGNLSGAPVFFEGNGVDRDAAAIEAGIHIEPMSRVSLELGYAGEIGANARNHGAEFRLRITF